MKMFNPTMTFAQLTGRFPTEYSCKEFLRDMRWPDGVTCPRCKNTMVHALKFKPFNWVCKAKDCGGKNGYRFTVITKTLFENTNYDLRVWFQTIYFMTQSKKGISAMQIHRQIGSGDYRSVWYMCHRICAAMKAGGSAKLMGIVNVDKTIVSGKDKLRHRNKGTDAAGIMGGKVDAIGMRLPTFVRRTVDSRVSLIATDERRRHVRLNREVMPQSMNHAKG